MEVVAAVDYPRRVRAGCATPSPFRTPDCAREEGQYWIDISDWLDVLGKKTALFLSSPYVCPEPVLAKRSRLYING
jgi:hypothetical protein